MPVCFFLLTIGFCLLNLLLSQKQSTNSELARGSLTPDFIKQSAHPPQRPPPPRRHRPRHPNHPRPRHRAHRPPPSPLRAQTSILPDRSVCCGRLFVLLALRPCTHQPGFQSPGTAFLLVTQDTPVPTPCATTEASSGLLGSGLLEPPSHPRLPCCSEVAGSELPPARGTRCPSLQRGPGWVQAGLC